MQDKTKDSMSTETVIETSNSKINEYPFVLILFTVFSVVRKTGRCVYFLVRLIKIKTK